MAVSLNQWTPSTARFEHKIERWRTAVWRTIGGVRWN